MSFSEYFPILNKLSQGDRALIYGSVKEHSYKKGELVHNGNDCNGLLVLASGQLRAYIMSTEGKEMTAYRLFERDICLLSASCIMSSIQFDINITAEKDTRVYIIPADIYKSVMERSSVLANYTNEIMATRFTDVVWLVEQIMWKSLDRRVADLLCKESEIENSYVLTLTHSDIASHLGSAREVVTRMLKYLQAEGYVKLSRGSIELCDPEGLYRLAGD